MATISIGNRPLEGLSVGQTFKDMDSAWYIVTAARGQKKKGRPKETRYRRITQSIQRQEKPQGEKERMNWIDNYPMPCTT